MKAVLLSIQPQHCKNIIDRIKTIEVRKKRPTIHTPFKCFIYCTKAKNKNDEFWIVEPDILYYANGSVIGEFMCNKINLYLAITIGLAKCEVNGAYVDEKFRYNAGACMDAEAMFHYSGGKNLYGWCIDDLKIYDTPKELSDFGLTRPPQSWCYVEEIEP